MHRNFPACIRNDGRLIQTRYKCFYVCSSFQIGKIVFGECQQLYIQLLRLVTTARTNAIVQTGLECNYANTLLLSYISFQIMPHWHSSLFLRLSAASSVPKVQPIQAPFPCWRIWSPFLGSSWAMVHCPQKSLLGKSRARQVQSLILMWCLHMIHTLCSSLAASVCCCSKVSTCCSHCWCQLGTNMFQWCTWSSKTAASCSHTCLCRKCHAWQVWSKIPHAPD